MLFLLRSRVGVRLAEGGEAAGGRVEELGLRETVSVALGAVVLHLGTEVPVSEGRQAQVQEVALLGGDGEDLDGIVGHREVHEHAELLQAFRAVELRVPRLRLTAGEHWLSQVRAKAISRTAIIAPIITIAQHGSLPIACLVKVGSRQ